MAELGSSFLSSLNGESDERKVDVNVDMLDYDYIGKCNDTRKLRSILEVLESGAEGSYPDLTKFAQESLLTLLPEKEKVKILRLNHKTTAQEIMEAEAELENRRREIVVKDSLLKQQSTECESDNSQNDPGAINAIFRANDVAPAATLLSKKNIPPVRGQATLPVSTLTGASNAMTKENSAPESSSEKPQRLSGYDFRAWEKFDVESACEEVESAEQTSSVGTTQKTVDLVAAAAEKHAAAHQREMRQLQAELGANALSAVQRSTRATREKMKGNECHKINENEEAFACYSRSLALDPTSAIVYGNRAVSCIRLERFELAEDDCTRALQIDKTYIKAWARRGMARFKRGKYREAASDFEEAALRDPSNAEYKNLAENAAAKFYEVEGRHLPSRLEQSAPPPPSSLQATTITISVTDAKTGTLLLPSAKAAEISRGVYTVSTVAASSGFTRIAICEEDDDDEDGEAEVSSSEAVGNGFTRVVIVEDDESGSEDEADEAAAAEKGKEQRAIDLKELGNACWAQSDKDGAVKAYTDSLALSPKLVASLNNRALAFISLTRYDDAASDSSKVLEIEPDNVKALFRRAVALQHLSQIDAACADLEKLLKIDPENAQGLKLLKELSDTLAAVGTSDDEWKVDQLKQCAMRELGEGNWAAAIATLEKALGSSMFQSANPAASNVEAQVSILSLLASAVSTMENYPRCIEACNSILGLQGKNFKALQRRAHAYSKLGNSEAALADYRTILQMDPSDADALAAVKELDDSSASKDGVQRLAASVRLKDRGNEAMSKQLFAEAVSFYTQSIANDPDNVLAYNNRAQAYLKLSRFIEAERDAAFVMSSCSGEDQASSSHYKKAAFRRALACRGMGGKVNVTRAAGLLSELVKLDAESKDFQLELKRTLQLQAELARTPAPTNQISPSLDMTERTSTKRVLPPTPPTVSSPLPPLAPSTEAAKESLPMPSASTTKKTTKDSPSAASRAPKELEAPQTPPATLYELERNWRALKSSPKVFADYLRCFKPATFRKVFKESLSSEIISSLLLALKDYSDETCTMAVLTGLTQSPSFDMMVTMLPAEDTLLVAAIFAKLDTSKPSVMELKGKYKA